MAGLASIELRNPYTGEVLRLELRPGTYYVGRVPDIIEPYVYLWSEDGKVMVPLFSWATYAVSRKHLKVTVTEDLDILVEDHGKEGRGSTNGTYVLKGGKVARLAPGEVYELAPGDVLFLSGTTHMDGRFEAGKVVIYVEGVNGRRAEMPESLRKEIKSMTGARTASGILGEETKSMAEARRTASGILEKLGLALKRVNIPALGAGLRAGGGPAREREGEKDRRKVPVSA